MSSDRISSESLFFSRHALCASSVTNVLPMIRQALIISWPWCSNNTTYSSMHSL